MLGDRFRTRPRILLIRHSISVINPSLFEGWSSTVEECKYIGKNLILSNINVHHEQDPPCCIYFDPNNSNELASILEIKWDNCKGGPDFELEEEAKKIYLKRKKSFGMSYQNIVLECFN